MRIVNKSQKITCECIVHQPQMKNCTEQCLGHRSTNRTTNCTTSPVRGRREEISKHRADFAQWLFPLTQRWKDQTAQQNKNQQRHEVRYCRKISTDFAQCVSFAWAKNESLLNEQTKNYSSSLMHPNSTPIQQDGIEKYKYCTTHSTAQHIQFFPTLTAPHTQTKSRWKISTKTQHGLLRFFAFEQGMNRCSTECIQMRTKHQPHIQREATNLRTCSKHTELQASQQQKISPTSIPNSTRWNWTDMFRLTDYVGNSNLLNGMTHTTCSASKVAE